MYHETPASFVGTCCNCVAYYAYKRRLDWSEVGCQDAAMLGDAYGASRPSSPWGIAVGVATTVALLVGVTIVTVVRRAR
jgi:hypothetical protein